MVHAVLCDVMMMMIWCCGAEREAEILKPLSSVEVVENDQATFDTEISEDDVLGEWKLRGQVLSRTPVTFNTYSFTSDSLHIKSISDDSYITLFIIYMNIIILFIS